MYSSSFPLAGERRQRIEVAITSCKKPRVPVLKGVAGLFTPIKRVYAPIFSLKPSLQVLREEAAYRV